VPNKPASGHHAYDHSKSPKYKKNGKPFHIEYGSGKVTGFYSVDDVTLGPLKLEQFLFAEIGDTSGLGPSYQKGHFDGILGLGWDQISTDNTPTFMNKLVASKQLSEQVFAFFLGDNAAGELVFGGVDPKHYSGEFHFVPLSETTYWQITLDGVNVGGKAVASPKAAIVDSGTSLLVGPTKVIEGIMKMIGARSESDNWIAGCSPGMKLPDLAFVLGGESFTITSEDYVLARDGGDCLLGLMGDSDDSMWILGDIFMRKYYVQFDWGQKRVGIAASAAVTSETLLV